MFSESQVIVLFYFLMYFENVVKTDAAKYDCKNVVVQQGS